MKTPSFAEMIPLLDQRGVHLRWVDEEEGRMLLRTHKVELLRTKKKVRALRLLPAGGGAAGPVLVDTAGFRRKRYSHQRETDSNPRGVWTLIHIPAIHRGYFLPCTSQNSRHSIESAAA